MTLEDTTAVEDLGARLRTIRQERGLSVREVARQADITPGFLSQLELGNKQVSIVTLYRICKVLGATVQETLGPVEPEHSITRAGQAGQMAIPSKSVNVDVLINVAGRPFDMLLVKLAPGSGTSPNLSTHNAKEAMMIIVGVATMEVGRSVVELHEGDTIYLNALIPHRIVNNGSDELRFVNVIVGEL